MYLVCGSHGPVSDPHMASSKDTSRWTRKGSRLLCRARPSTAPHEANHCGPIPYARATVQSLGVRYSSPPGLLNEACHGDVRLQHTGALPVARGLWLGGLSDLGSRTALYGEVGALILWMGAHALGT